MFIEMLIGNLLGVKNPCFDTMQTNPRSGYGEAEIPPKNIKRLMSQVVAEFTYFIQILEQLLIVGRSIGALHYLLKDLRLLRKRQYGGAKERSNEPVFLEWPAAEEIEKQSINLAFE
jgi:hypothetical protein